MICSSNMLKSLLLCVVLTGFFSAGLAQTALTDPLPLDKDVLIGRLENGLTYYIRQNKKPEQKVELRLAVNVGSIVEDENQRGLAHMSEHMAFNGTKNFKKNDIVSFLQDIGVGFGSDLNAYTGFDETVYILPIPTDKPGNLEKGFQVLEDWAHQVTYLNEDIESERAIILEESRLGKGAQDRMFKQVYPKLFAGSKYAERIPIGVDSIIKNFNPDLIRKFYKDWYRPNLMAVVVVGDITPDSALLMIKKHFAGMVNPPNERKRTFVSIQPYDASEAMVITDKEATGYAVNINYPIKPSQPEKTIGDYRNSLKRQLFSTILSQRLQELTQQANPPFVGAGSGFGNFIRGHENFRAYANVGNGDINRGLDAVTEEIERAKRFGFTAAELGRSKKSMLSSMDRLYNNRDKTESELFVDEYLRNFLSAEPLPGITTEHALYGELIPGIELDEVNALAKTLTADSNRLVYITGPAAGATEKLPLPAELLARIAAKEKATIKPYEEKLLATSLMKTLPVAGKLISRKEDRVMGVTKLILSNGVTVTLKTTNFKNDQILMGATRPGGKNYYGVADKYNAEYAVPAVSAMGVGEFSVTDLRKLLAGKTVAVNPLIGEVSDGFRGNCGNKDVETMLQLVHLYVTQPRKDTALFRSFIQRNKSQFAAMGANPQTAFIDTMFSVLYNKNPLAPIAVPKTAYFDQINLDRALAIYKERVGDASGMNFVLVGSFSVDSILPLIQTYLGSLPSSGKKFVAKDNGVRPVKGQQTLTVHKGKEQKSLILSFFNGEIPYSEALELKAQAVSDILNIRIIEEFREKIQGIYGGGIYANLEKYPYNNYSMVLQLPCGPEKVDTLLKATKAEFNALAAKGPLQSYLDKVKKQWLEQYRTNMKENGTWLNALLNQQAQGASAKYFLQYESLVEKLTVKEVQAAAKILLQGKNQFTAVLLPETVEKTTPAKKAF
jgi:zinc protease